MIQFTLPDELIAQQPVHPRDAARLLVYDRQSGKITDTVFNRLQEYLPVDSTLVMNNAKVDHCRWLFEPSSEIFILDKLDQHTVRALVRPGRKFKLGSVVALTDWLSVQVTSIDQFGIRTLQLSVQHDDPRLTQYEHVPLPPYIKQDDSLAEEYQTVYAKNSGSKAAPTAGLHFTDALLANISKTHTIAEITLHVGLGTFAPLTESQIKQGKLHTETYDINAQNSQLIHQSRHTVAVGTTTVRTLESIEVFGNGPIVGSTDILIMPGYRFSHVQSMITNFHLPGTSLLLLVEAFVGSKSELQKIYDHAIAHQYRFYSFGDAMLIL